MIVLPKMSSSPRKMDGKKMILSFWGMFCLVSGVNLLEGRPRRGVGSFFLVVRGDGADDGMSGVLKVSDVQKRYVSSAMCIVSSILFT